MQQLAYIYIRGIYVSTVRRFEGQEYVIPVAITTSIQSL